MKTPILNALRGLLQVVLAMAASQVAAQTTAPPTNNVGADRPSLIVTPAAAPAINAATTLAREPLDKARTVVPRPVPVVVIGTATPVSEGARVLQAPGACTPKTNSLDCVQDSSQAGDGANVSGKVRSGVIGEVGTGRSTTEGKGDVQRQDTCTPKPGELSCKP